MRAGSSAFAWEVRYVESDDLLARSLSQKQAAAYVKAYPGTYMKLTNGK